MVRTIVSLEEEDKAWLDLKAEQEQVSMAELIRRAVHRYREESASEPLSVGQLLAATSGIWQGEEALLYQRRLRGEWDDR